MKLPYIPRSELQHVLRRDKNTHLRDWNAPWNACSICRKHIRGVQ